MRKKLLCLLISLTLVLPMFPVSAFAESPIVTDGVSKDVFLNVDSDSGYDAAELAAAVNSEIDRLAGGTAPAVRVKTNNTQIDTTDLANWYVYDHYDTAYWSSRASVLFSAGKIASNDSSLAWKYDMGMDSLTSYKRPYSGQTYSETDYSSYGYPSTITRLEDFIAIDGYLGNVRRFDQHIYSGADSNGAFMTFVGYGSPAYTDFLFYPDQLSGTKTVTYTIDSTDVQTHSLASAGFLCNTGIDENGYITGYILVYAYSSPTTYSLNLYPINAGVTARQLVDSSYINQYCGAAITPLVSGTLSTLTSTDVTLTITPDSVKVEHKAPAASSYTTMKEWTGLAPTEFNGFGPYVKYSSHGCWQTSSYKYTNLKMSSSTAAGSTVSAFASLQNADYLDEPSTEHYLINILGSTGYDLANDENYLSLVQTQNIDIFTNKDIEPISGYLPKYYVDTTSITLEDLSTSIASYILGLTTGTVNTTPSPPALSVAVANFVLTSAESQVSQIKRELIPAGGVIVDVDNKSIVPDGEILGTPTYTLTDPTGAAEEISVPFTVTNDSANWPIGEYTLKMDYGGESIPCSVHFNVLGDVTAPAVSAVKNGNNIELTFTNHVSDAEFSFASNLDSYTVMNTGTSGTPTVSWEDEAAIVDNGVSASEPITQSGYMHIFVKDEAGNVGHTSIEITQLIPTITAPAAATINYGQPLSESILTGGAASFNSVAVDGGFSWVSPGTKPNAGTTSYSVRFAPDSALYATVTTDVAIVVNKGTPGISLSDKTATYNGSPIHIGGAVVTGVPGGADPTGAVTYTYYTDISCTTLTTPGNSGALINGGAPALAGKYYAKATIADAGNYISAVTAAPGTLTIVPASDEDLLISGVPSTITYGDPGFMLSGSGGNGIGELTFTSSNPFAASITTNGYVTINNAGSTVITVTKASDGNYNAQTAEIVIDVNQKATVYTITGNTKAYTGVAQYAKIRPSDSSLEEGVDFTVTYMQGSAVIEEPTETGEYDILVETTNDNYTGSSTEGKLTIQSVDQDYMLQIGGLPAYLEYEDTFALYANGGNGEGSVTWAVTSDGSTATIGDDGFVEITGVGSVTITATKAADSNYNEQSQSVEFIVNKKEVRISFRDTAKVYNGTIQSVSIVGTAVKNNILSDIVDVLYEMQSDSEQTDFRNIGTYNVSAEINPDYADLYSLEGYDSATASIAAAELVIMAEDKTKIYGDENPEFTLSYTLLGEDVADDGFFNSPVITCSAVAESDAGSYDIVLSYDGDPGNTNYAITLIDGKLTIEKASLEVVADDETIQYNESMPQCTVSYNGFVAGDDSADLGGTLEISCDYVKGDDIGTYELIPSGMTSDNYDITFSNGVLTVEKLTVSIAASGTSRIITVRLTPALPGLTVDKFTLTQNENNITIVSVTEGLSGGKYMIQANLIEGTEYQLTINNGENYNFPAADFIAATTSFGGGGGGASTPASPITIPEIPEEIVENPAEDKGFKDVKDSDWFFSDVEYVSNAGLMSGTSENTFGPKLSATRGMIVTILHRMEGEPKAGKISKFKDVESEKWYAEAVDWAAENSIVSGYGANDFKPEENISRQQLAAILYRYAEFKGYDVSKISNISSFSDENEISDWARMNMNWAIAEGLIQGTSKDVLEPNGKATRAQLASMLVRFHKLFAK